MILEGEKVRLRPAVRDDLATYTRWYTDPELRHYMGPQGETFDALQSPPSDQVNFSVEPKDGRLIGFVFITLIRTISRHCELGLVAIGEGDYWDKGYGSEMVRMALGYCFRELNMHQVHVETAEFNERARRCYGSIFPHEQRHREWVWEDGRFWDGIYFDITEEEFNASDSD